MLTVLLLERNKHTSTLNQSRPTFTCNELIFKTFSYVYYFLSLFTAKRYHHICICIFTFMLPDGVIKNDDDTKYSVHELPKDS